MSSDSFSNALMANNPDLAKEVATLAKDAQGSQSTSDALLNAGLTADQKKNMLLNGLDANPRLAIAVSQTANELNPNPAKIQDTLAAVRAAIEASTDDAAKTAALSDLDSIESRNLEPAETLEEIQKVASISGLCTEVFKTAAREAMESLDPQQLQDAFQTMASNPAIANLLAESNPAIETQLAALRDPNTIFGPDGLPVARDTPLTSEVITKLTELQEIDANKSKFANQQEIIVENNEVMDFSDPENPVKIATLGQLVDKFGSAVLTKALSASEATAVQSNQALAEDLRAEQDIEAMRSSVSNNGDSPDRLANLNQSEAAVLDDIKRNLEQFSNAQNNQSVTSVCNIHKTLVEDQDTNTTTWLVKNKIAIDFLLTIEIEEWVNKALKANIVNHTTYNAKKIEIANY